VGTIRASSVEAGFVSAVFSALRAASGSSLECIVLDRSTAADFEPLVGGGFTAVPPGRDGLAAELLDVRMLREPPPGQPPRKPFALTFRVRTPDRLPQGMFALTHERLDRLEIFLVPVGRDADGLLLEAVFN